MPVPPVQFGIDYFGVDYTDPDGEKLSSVLDRIAAIPNDGSRNKDVGVSPVRMQELATSDRGWYEGDLVRIRMNELPKKASLEGAVAPINLRADEGIGEETAFLFDPVSNVVVLQRNRFGVGYKAFEEYLNSFVTSNVVSVNPLLRSDAVRQLRDMRGYRKVEIGLAGIETVRSFQTRRLAVGESADIMQTLGAPNLQITFSMGHSGDDMNRQGVLTTVNQILRAAGDGLGITKLRVTGKHAHADKDIIDLIEERMSDSRPVAVDRRRTLPYQTRKDELRASFVNHQGDINTLRVRARNP